MDLRDKVVLITGGARRVGRVIALELAKRGARIALHYNKSRAEAEAFARDLQKSFGRDAAPFRADLSRAQDAVGLAKKVGRRFGHIDVLINSASIYEKNIFGRTKLSDWDRHLDTNLRAPFFLTQECVRFMPKGGHIINIADWAALRPYAEYMPYCVSKAGLLCLNSALAKALAPKIQVNAIMPGPVMLPENFSAKQRRAVVNATLLKRLGTPEDVAQAVLFLLERGDFITGAALPVDGGRLIA